MVTALMICGLSHRTSLSYEPSITEFIFILNQKVYRNSINRMKHFFIIRSL